MSVKDLHLQLDLLGALDAGMYELTADASDPFAGLSICLHQPGTSPLNPLSQTETADQSLSSWIGDDGCLHLVVEEKQVADAIQRLDLDRAELLTRLHSFWERRATELKDSMKALFQVEDVLCDTSSGASAQQFVLWAGCIMSNRYRCNAWRNLRQYSSRDEMRKRLSGKHLPLTLLIHSDDSAPMVDYSTASSTLHIRTDCSPTYLLDYVQSDRCLDANDAAKEMLTDDIEERRILEEARKALGAKNVIRICSVYERQQVQPNAFSLSVAVSVGYQSS